MLGMMKTVRLRALMPDGKALANWRVEWRPEGLVLFSQEADGTWTEEAEPLRELEEFTAFSGIGLPRSG